jgi:hypothetical protein
VYIVISLIQPWIPSFFSPCKTQWRRKQCHLP